MTTELGQLLLLVAAFWMALGALLAILDRIESSMYDDVATRPDGSYVHADGPNDDPIGLPGQRRRPAGPTLVAGREPGVATPLSG